ncbi:hypothetical protein XH30_001447 [Salmonella enterica subsp. enterica serovar Bredeney]|uniref:Uncharacterized protein n=1 Tax=Salmonella enterica subsp. enterica serovar Bredeney TaxID=134047 RepID=A0A726RC98_SALET|nr:hypothetical protein [Salmonella phage S107]AXC42173.1 hypothetical protein [Salmonella phage S135]AXC42257.1 hypothetical protein [Salmonella phage S137]EBV6931537.1 hypothetical protein [Salmonella enterica subsp. enterica serovar Bredeney]ECU7871931.1 hypothetical protein [Salmonella enterica subsp. enterica serovar Derby]
MQALQRVSAPVYVVSNHGKTFRCFSRNTAIKRLAHFMTQRMFCRSGIETRPVTKVDRDDVAIHYINKPIQRYWDAQARCERRLRKILSRK